MSLLAPVTIIASTLLPFHKADTDTIVIFGAFMNAGQICMSSERIIVPESQYETLVSELQKAWSGISSTPRALFSTASASRVRDLVTDAKGKGAKNIFAASTNDSDAHITPLILGPVDGGMRLHTEESFGPLCVLIPVPDSGSEEELIDAMVCLANDTDYGLSASVWGADVGRAEAVARRIQAGAVHVNAPTPHDVPPVPHGGWKSSGWGRFNGVEGVKSFTQTRSIEIPGKKAQPMPLNVFEL